MERTRWPGGCTMDDLAATLTKAWPSVRFKPSDEYRWSPQHHTVFYDAEDTSEEGAWTLLHETGHALLDHSGYKLDFELLQLELAAWERARLLAGPLGITIPAEHIEDCLDTYRTWLYRRSICPHCEAVTLQHDAGCMYQCHNCASSWKVSPSRFCRPYRARQTV